MYVQELLLEQYCNSNNSEMIGKGIEDVKKQPKEMLDYVHTYKIDIADEIFAINVGEYIGSSAQSKIEYTITNSKKVRLLGA